MPVSTDWVRYGEQGGYLAWPERAPTPQPSVLVIQEIWGVDAHIQDVCRRIAAAGYAALAPDLYAPGGRRPEELSAERVDEVKAFMSALPRAAWADPAAREAELAKRPKPERARIGKTHAALFANLGQTDRFVALLTSSTRYLREMSPVARGQKVACVGFCMGGGLSALLACADPDLAGAAVFYGSSPPAERVAAIRCPIIGFYGGLDARVNAGVPAFADAMGAAGKAFERHVYDGAQHAFFNDTRASYDVRAARDSFARLLDFFRRTAGA
jgi:carboxymethylenebutenolidase